jgi:hypothetical protein
MWKYQLRLDSKGTRILKGKLRSLKIIKAKGVNM